MLFWQVVRSCRLGKSFRHVVRARLPLHGSLHYVTCFMKVVVRLCSRYQPPTILLRVRSALYMQRVRNSNTAIGHCLCYLYLVTMMMSVPNIADCSVSKKRDRDVLLEFFLAHVNRHNVWACDRVVCAARRTGLLTDTIFPRPIRMFPLAWHLQSQMHGRSGTQRMLSLSPNATHSAPNIGG